LSLCIGAYHGCIRSKQLSTNEFLFADVQMKALRTAMSLMATIISAASLLGGPAEIYPYENISLCLAGIAWLIGTYSTANIFIPIFRRLGHISLYTYLEQRFSLSVRIVITSTFLIINTCFIPIILSGPSLALSQVTGLYIWFAIGSCGIICTLCTSVGSMKAAIWADVTQTILILLASILIIIFGVIRVDGIQKVFDIAMAGNRI
ncbi:unnamed protein product, partial [Rotaria magnacalcarata]